MSLPDAPAPRVVLLTGAGGFIGRWTARVLTEAGLEVRGFGRTDPAPSTAAFHVGDLLDAGALREAIAGVDTVIHLAARVHVMREAAAEPLLEFRKVNVEGTRVLLEEIARAGVRRLLFASTVKAVGEESGERYTEATVPRPQDPYGVSKLEAEQLITREAGPRGVDATSLRLPLVYGPGMKGNMLSLFRAVARGMPLPLGLVDNRRSLAFVGNVAAAILTLLRSPRALPGPYYVSDDQDLSTAELARLIGRALGREARLLPVPPALFRAAGRLGDLAARVAPLPLSSAAVTRLLGSLAVDSSALSRDTGFHPPYSVEEGLGITARWFRTAGL